MKNTRFWPEKGRKYPLDRGTVQKKAARPTVPGRPGRVRPREAGRYFFLRRMCEATAFLPLWAYCSSISPVLVMLPTM